MTFPPFESGDAFDAVSLCVHFAIEHKIARWLPWWRRYLSCLPGVIDVLWVRRADTALWWGCAFVGGFILGSNIARALHNRRDGNDQRKAEAKRSAELTEVQRAAFRRQVVEAA